MAGYMDPILAQIARQGDIMMYGQQMQRQRQQDEAAQRQRGLQERMTLAQLAQMEHQNNTLNTRRRTLADLAAPRQVGGPLDGAENYQPLDFQAPAWDDTAAYQALMGAGDVEGALQFRPKPQVIGGADSGYFEYTPGQQPRQIIGGKPQDQFEGLDTDYKTFLRANRAENTPEAYRAWQDNVLAQKRAGASSFGGGTPYYTPVQTADGIFSFNARTGNAVPLDVNGRPVIGAAADPTLQRNIAAGKAAGEIEGKTGAQAKIDLPANIKEAELTIKLVDDLLKHPGFKQAVGTSSLLGIQHVAGTPAKAFMVRQNQLKGKQFLQAFESLKGGGHITEIEGQKATDAMSRMDNATTEEEYIAAAREFQGVIRQGVENAKLKAKGAPTAPQAPKIQFLGFE